jgi:phosphonate transport system substrate-binding protein
VPPVEPLAAAVLEGNRYRGRPIYFSDVVVRSDSPIKTFADLHHRSWSYNEPRSHSGYLVTLRHLLRLRETKGFFSRVVRAGWHQRSIRMVLDGGVDASAIDSQVLDVSMSEHPEQRERLRVIEVLGPSTIQPVVVRSNLPANLKAELRHLLLELHQDPRAQPALRHTLVDHFASVDDGDYDDIRNALRDVEAANFTRLR